MYVGGSRKALSALVLVAGMAMAQPVTVVKRIDELTLAERVARGTYTNVKWARARPDVKIRKRYAEDAESDPDEGEAAPPTKKGSLLLVDWRRGGTAHYTFVFPTMVLSLDFAPGQWIGVGAHRSIDPTEVSAAVERLRNSSLN